MHRLVYTICLLVICFQSFGQKEVTLMESSMLIAPFSEKEFYYAFAEGDELHLEFQILKGKHLKEIELVEYPSTVKLIEAECTSLKNRTLTIPRTGIYKFSFSNGALRNRKAYIKISRTPKDSSTLNFNSAIEWEEVSDTIYRSFTETYTEYSDTNVVTLANQMISVASINDAGINKSSFNFTLPQNMVKWAYYIGVDDLGRKAYQEAERKLFMLHKEHYTAFPNYNPLVAMCFQEPSYLAPLQTGEDIEYSLIRPDQIPAFINGQVFQKLQNGKSRNAFQVLNNPKSGMYTFCFENDNAVTPVNVYVRIVAVTMQKEVKTREKQKAIVRKLLIPRIQD